MKPSRPQPIARYDASKAEGPPCPECREECAPSTRNGRQVWSCGNAAHPAVPWLAGLDELDRLRETAGLIGRIQQKAELRQLDAAQDELADVLDVLG